MLKKIGFSLLCVAASISSSYAVSKNNILQAGATLEYELPPNEAQTFSNYMFWEVEADCKIFTQDEGNVLFAKATAKKGKLNGIPWVKGDTLRVTVHDGEILKITASPGAQVQITNEGEHLVKAICSN
ncbi:hypothetical protein [Legionella sp. km772]|uniref:hypothetical protein n=1 Tax=Legionella sp. km772 TaxID=2498111 RepID=UPI000F8F4ABE|nr:hypothetical protein [Legionella sp. km772]RUR13278.1 hypothetical protein ELY15_02790 [Legionella sp. km772]